MKIFLSSTFVDLSEHRKAIDETINRMTLQYKGMEYFGSRSYEPKLVCFQEISGADVFVGVYAHRYGWVPSGDFFSITEQEYDYAKSIGLPCLLYLVDDSHSWNPQLIEKGELAERLTQFKAKVSSQVISRFTTPDNIAKQIAADLSRDTLNLKSEKSLTHICSSLTKLINRDIKSTIGPKYISTLFVKRALSKTYPQLIKEYIELGDKIQCIQNLTNKTIDITRSQTKLVEKLSIPKKNERKKGHNNGNSLFVQFQESTNTIEKLPASLFTNNGLCFPATDVLIALDQLISICPEIESTVLSLKSDNQIDQEAINSVSYNVSQIKQHSAHFCSLVKPITVLIDRAGGGKTNLLCDLSVQLSEKAPVFFISAKSVLEPNVESILEYIKIAYPISNDPISDALEVSIREKSAVLIIIDGINEHYDPGKFNVAIKKFIQSYYGFPVRFLISCRDIYWRFFEDDWWTRHSNEIFRDELKSFRANEFKKALPKYLNSFEIDVTLEGVARQHLCHPLLLRFFCEAYRGTSPVPNRLGIVKDVRLLPLFDTYCQRKYEEIRTRLNLASSSEIGEFVSMIGLIMLNEERRLIPIEKVRQRALKQFGEINFFSGKSKYVQILDEDIIIEQKPSKSISQLNVEFVYDEFMEYVIANAKFSGHRFKGDMPALEKALELISELIPQQDNFVSVTGILAFVGEMVAEGSVQNGLSYIDRLIELEMKELVCQILGRWPEKSMTNKVVEILISLHASDESHDVRKRAWQALEEIHWRFWERIYLYMTCQMEHRGFFRISRVFSFLKRSNGGTTNDEKFESLCWIGDKLTVMHDIVGANFTSGFSAFEYIYKCNCLEWTKVQKERVTRLYLTVQEKSNKKIQRTV